MQQRIPNLTGLGTKFLPVTTRPFYSKGHLFAIRKGRILSDDVFDGDDVITTRSSNAKKSSRRKKDIKTVSNVSSDLAAWIENEAISKETDRNTQFNVSDKSKEKDIETKKERKPKRNNQRRVKQAEKKAVLDTFTERANVVTEKLSELLEGGDWDRETIIDELSSLLEISTEREMSNIGNSLDGIRAIAGGQTRRNFKMAWVGSDDTICHVGTGLHNVPLARLQEVFLTIGQSRVELYEVISIIGPFPNVKNTLKGDAISTSSGKTLKITYDTMIDGAGKELLAGKEDNVRKVDLDVLFANSRAILAKVPGADEPMKDDGKDLLLFLVENDLDLRLESLRVS